MFIFVVGVTDLRLDAWLLRTHVVNEMFGMVVDLMVIMCTVGLCVVVGSKLHCCPLLRDHLTRHVNDPLCGQINEACSLLQRMMTVKPIAIRNQSIGQQCRHWTAV